jgi:aspartyl/asparaginyl-tRNA synthetase
MKHTKIVDVLKNSKVGEKIVVKGWVRAFRSNRFIQLNDGSTINNLQAVVDFEHFEDTILKKITTASALGLTGVLVESQGAGQAIELQVSEIEIIGEANPDEVQKTVMQPKKHSLEFLREQAHLRFRTNTFAAVFRIRHGVSYAIHKFFNDKGFYYLHTPIITGSDAEGAGEMFRVSTLNLYDLPEVESKEKKPRFLEVYEATKDIREKYSSTILSFLESNNFEYYKEDNEFKENSELLNELISIKSLDKILKMNLRELNTFKKAFKDQFKDNKHDLKKIEEFITKLFLKIKVYFKEGKFNYDLRKMKIELKKIEKLKGWKFNFDQSHHSIDEMPLFALSFYNQFKVYNHDYIDYSEDFFGKQVNLTVSGQLEAELGALALGQVYTFGPTFRAENSNTSRHLAEFWMIEPEVAFNDINDNMDLAEEMLKYICQYIMDNFADDLKFLNDREVQEQASKPANERNEMSLIEKLNFVVANDFKRITYTEAIDVLMNSNHYKKKKFKYDVEWGTDLQSEHERYLVEKEFKRPVIIVDYPASFKAFYMRKNDNCSPDKQTVAAMDILFPGIGEMVGGSQREERLEILKEKMAAFNIPEEELWWYLETRKFGTVPHAGFGLGFERMVMFVTGMSNIRDVIPFPRTPKNAEF